MSAVQKTTSEARSRRGAAYNGGGILKRNLRLFHGLEYDVERLHEVAEDDSSPLFPVVLRETAGVNEAHLLEDCGLSALAGAFDGDQ